MINQPKTDVRLMIFNAHDSVFYLFSGLDPREKPAALSPASQPEENANLMLYPPQSPLISRTSPAKKRPGQIWDPMVLGSILSVLTPPEVTCASLKERGAFTSTFSSVSTCTISLRMFLLIFPTGMDRSRFRRFPIRTWPSFLGT